MTAGRRCMIFGALMFVALMTDVSRAQSQREVAAREVANANNEFTTALYNQLRKVDPNGNLLFSPFSLSSAMAMVQAGAKGATADEIRRGMRYPQNDVLYNGYSDILGSLKSNENFTLETANRLFTQTGFKLNPEYVSTLRNYFGAAAEQLDFAKSAQAAQSINRFVEDTTRNKIKDLVSPDDFDSLTRLVLVNAIYFKGLWENKFDPEFTRQAPFYVTPTKNVTVDLMKSERDYPYLDLSAELDAKAVALPYKGNRLSLIVILPNKQDGLPDLEKKLANFKISDIPPRMRSKKLSLSMPKFKLESTIDLSETLKSLGMTSMFGPSADFGNIPEPGSHEQLQLSKAVQKAFLEVNEEGSEAAAATGVQLTLKSAFFGQLIKFEHPFLALIYDNQTSTTLFVNSINDPTSDRVELKAEPRSSGDANDLRSNTPLLFLITASLLHFFAYVVNF